MPSVSHHLEGSLGELLTFLRPDGKTCPAYLATPQAGTPVPAIIVVQEWWGLNDQMKRTADHFADTGYCALVPDLYRGKVAKTADEANQLMSALNFRDITDQDIRGAIQFMKRSSERVAVGGFCMGGAIALLAAVRVSDMDAGVCFYGIPPLPTSEFQKITIPLICHFANLDERHTPAKVDELEAALKQSKSQFELFRYDAHHGFMNEDRPKAFAPASSKLAWDRTLTFLEKTIG